MTTPDLAPFMMPGGQSELGFHTGTVVSWDEDAATNSVRILGTVVSNLPVLTAAGIVGLSAGDTVGILRFKSTYFILGRIVSQDSGLVNPQFPVVLYPQFTSKVAAGALGPPAVDSGVLPTWEGRVKPAHPFIEVDGIWGNLSGSGSTTYAVKLGGATVGSGTSTTLDVARKGPFDVTSYMGQDWLKIELAVTASTGTGEKAVAPLAMYFRQP